MLVVDEKLARSVLCSTMDSEAIYRPPWVDPVHLDQLKQAFDSYLGVERCHRFTRAPQYPRLAPCGGDESFAHHVPELVLAIVIEQVAQIAHLIQENSEELMTPTVTSTSFEQLGNEAVETWAVRL